MSEDVFCPLPWVLQATRNDGVFRVCAHSQNNPKKGIATDHNGAVYMADQASWSQARNADSLNAIRKDFLQNRWPEACSRCRMENESGVASRQREEAKRYEHTFSKSQARAVTAGDGSIISSPVRELDIRFGNRCNLRCTMCSAKASDQWYKDHLAVWGDTFKNWRDEPVRLIQKDGRVNAESTFDEWYDSDVFIEEIKKCAPGVRKIHFSGGEPLLVNRFYDVLDALVEYGVPEETTVDFITNGTLLPSRLEAYFPLFFKINIGLSIDGIGDKHDYIRYPSKWNTIEKFIQKIETARHNVDPWVAFTCMVYNILDIPEVVEWRDRGDFLKLNNNSTRPVVMDHPLHNPAHLSAQILPRAVKLRVRDKLESYMAGKKHFESAFLRANSTLARENLENIVSAHVHFMMAEDRSELLPKFFKYTARLDRARNNSFWRAFPELGEWLQPYRQDYDSSYKDQSL